MTNVVIAHTNSAPCLTEEECLRQINFLHALYTESKQKLDIPFNFLIGGDGRAYEVTGWSNQADTLRGSPSFHIFKILSPEIKHVFIYLPYRVKQL